MSNRFLVTGGSGFIGSALVKALLKQGHKVRSFDNLWRGSAENLKGLGPNLEHVAGDIRDPESVSKAIAGVDTVCHLAAINGTKNFYSKPDLVLDVAIRGMIHVMDGCRKNKVRNLVFMSTSEVYQSPHLFPTPETAALSIPDPLNPRYSYGAGKIASEMMLLHASPSDFDRVQIVRPHNVYGPAMGWDHVIPELAAKILSSPSKRRDGLVDLPIQGSGKETRSFIYVDDMVRGFLTVMEKGENREIYHVGTEDEISIIDLATKIGNTLGVRLRLVPGKLASGGTLRRCPDTTKVRNLGFRPQFSLDEGLKLTLDWYTNNFEQKPQEAAA